MTTRLAARRRLVRRVSVSFDCAEDGGFKSAGLSAELLSMRTRQIEILLVAVIFGLTAVLTTTTAHAAPPDWTVKGGGDGFSRVVKATAKSNSARSGKVAKTRKPRTLPTPTPSTPTVPVPAPASGTLPEFGTQFHGMWSSYTDTQRAKVLDTLKANGVTTVRLDVSWAMLQPNGPTFDTWGTNFVTRVLKMITDRQMKPMVMIWLTPSWLTGSSDSRIPPSTSDQLQKWEDFTEQLADRFPQVSDWEVWNEANHNDFMRGADPAVYAKVLTSANRGLKRGNSRATVVFAGTQFVDVPWIRKALKAGAQGNYDVMGVHPYMGVGNASPDLPDDGTIWRLRHIPELRSAMMAAGDNKPIWFTEFGWRAGSTGTANWQLGVDQDTQATYLAKTLEIVRSEWSYVKRVYWYRELADNNTSQSSGYGLILPNGTPKPALTQIPSIYAG